MIGEKIGRYILLETVGSGSMGTVYKAEDPATGTTVAVKLIRSLVLYNLQIRERFLQEVIRACEIRDRRVCRILEIGDDDDDFFIVMPFIQGVPLESMRNRKNLPWRRVLDIIIEAGEALSTVHSAGTVHRGIKPSNLWIQNDHSILLSDCCLARFTELGRDAHACYPSRRAENADTLIPLTAIAYMSPEQIRGESVDRRTDIFSLGVIAYELLAARHPFEARNSLSRISAILEGEPPTLTSKTQDLPSELDGVIRKSLAKPVKDRYSDMNEFLEALRALRCKSASPDARAANLPLGKGPRLLGWPHFYAALLIVVLSALILFYLLRK